MATGSVSSIRSRGMDSLEYIYDYEGRISTGVGEIGGYREDVFGGREMSGLGIRAKVKVQRRSVYTLAIKVQLSILTRKVYY